jgi:hypothetical protein
MEMKRESKMGENACKFLYLIEGLISRIYKQLLQLKRQVLQIKNGKYFNGRFSKRHVQVIKKHTKMCSASF